MNAKKHLAFLICLTMVFSFTACKDDITEDGAGNHSDEISTTQVNFVDNNSTDVYVSEIYETEVSDGAVTDSVPGSVLSTIATTSAVQISSMTKAEIVELYKNSAVKSHSSVTSQHSAEITKIVINGEELSGAFDFVKKIISSFISKNTEDTKGITGGYKNLMESDVKSAKIYDVGNNTAIEIILNEQTDGAKADVHGGSVGRAIDVVGDISVVTSELTDLGLPIEISSETTTVHYTNPSVKVIIDENGKIICGTWRYTVEIRLKNYKAFGADVESSSIVMDNVITVNGGFVK